MRNWIICESSHAETISPNLARFADDLIKKYQYTSLPSTWLTSKERKPYLKQARVSSWHPYIDQPRPSGGEKEAKKIKMATTLGADKKGMI